jgi:hypothetical protein
MSDQPALDAGRQGQGPFEVLAGLGHLAELDMGLGQQPVPAGPQGQRRLAAQGRPEHGLGLPEPASVPVERAQPGQVAVEVGRVAVVDQPVGGRPEVLDVGVELGPGRQGVGRVGEQAGEPDGMAAARLGLLGRVGGQAPPGVLAQQLVHAVAPVLAHLDQGVVDQAAQQGQPGLGHGGGRVQVEAAAQDREAAQGPALGAREQLPGPVDHRPEAAVARGHVGGGRLQQLGPGGQPVGDGRRGGRADPAGGQLDGQRHPADQPAHPPDGGQVGVRPEPGPQQPGPVLEQPHGRVAGRPGVGPGRRVGQAAHLDQPLGPEPEPPPRGAEHLDLRRPGEQVGQDPGGVAELLQVVEDQQQRAGGQEVGQQLPRVPGHGQRHPEGCGQVGHHQDGGLLRPRRGGPGERHRHHPVPVPPLPGRPHLHGQPRLPDPPGPDQGDEPARRVVQEGVQPGQVLLPPDQGSERPGRP